MVPQRGCSARRAGTTGERLPSTGRRCRACDVKHHLANVAAIDQIGAAAARQAAAAKQHASALAADRPDPLEE